MTVTGSRPRASRGPDQRQRWLEALGWVATGAAIMVASWRMPRLEALHMAPWSAPGLLPGVVGLLMMAFGVAIVALRGAGEAIGSEIGVGPGADGDGADPDAEGGRRAAGNGNAKRADAAAVDGEGPAGAGLEQAGAAADAADPQRSGVRATVAALVLCLGYAGVMVGHGVSFVVASAIFVFAFIGWFAWPDWRRRGRGGVIRGLVSAAVIAVATSALFAWLFESVFLVRLP